MRGKPEEHTFISCHDPLLGPLCFGTIKGDRDVFPDLQENFESLMEAHHRENFFMHYIDDYISWNFIFTAPNSRSKEFCHKVMISVVVNCSNLRNNQKLLMKLFSQANHYRSELYALKHYFLRHSIYHPQEMQQFQQEARGQPKVEWYDDVNRSLQNILNRRTWRDY